MFSRFLGHASTLVAALAGILLAASGLTAAEPGPDLLPTVGSIERLDPRFDAAGYRGLMLLQLAEDQEHVDDGPFLVSDRGRL
jgi:hypothetical protein